ncbi:MAG: hypothetical protein LUH06_02330, partial [Oscillospiraceae bacterium]|nr:hypothetical protein [Oscillospiraceae bacterium]
MKVGEGRSIYKKIDKSAKRHIAGLLCNVPFEKRKGEKKQSFYSRPRFGGRKANLRCNIAGRSKLALFSKANRFQKHIVTESVTRFSADVNRKFTFFATPRFFAVL